MSIRRDGLSIRKDDIWEVNHSPPASPVGRNESDASAVASFSFSKHCGTAVMRCDEAGGCLPSPGPILWKL